MSRLRDRVLTGGAAMSLREYYEVASCHPTMGGATVESQIPTHPAGELRQRGRIAVDVWRATEVVSVDEATRWLLANRPDPLAMWSALGSVPLEPPGPVFFEAQGLEQHPSGAVAFGWMPRWELQDDGSWYVEADLIVEWRRGCPRLVGVFTFEVEPDGRFLPEEVLPSPELEVAYPAAPMPQFAKLFDVLGDCVVDLCGPDFTAVLVLALAACAQGGRIAGKEKGRRHRVVDRIEVPPVLAAHLRGGALL